MEIDKQENSVRVSKTVKGNYVWTIQRYGENELDEIKKIDERLRKEYGD